jgi:hypothetical protein
MRLYIANPTHQNQTVFWRADINSSGVYDERRAKGGLRSVSIRPGQQTPLPDFEHLNQAQSVMDQLAKVGGIGVEEVPNRLPRQRIAYVLSIDKPVTKKAIDAVNDHNRGLSITTGQRNRKAAAIAANEAVDRMVREASGTAVRNMTVEIEQERQQLASDSETPSKELIAEGYDVLQPGEDPSDRKKLRTQRRRTEV